MRLAAMIAVSKPKTSFAANLVPVIIEKIQLFPKKFATL